MLERDFENSLTDVVFYDAFLSYPSMLSSVIKKVNLAIISIDR